MSATKCTMLLQLSTVSQGASAISRLAGWSETVYSTLGIGTALSAQFEDLCARRALALPRFSQVLGQRYQQVDPIGRSFSTNKVFAGLTSIKADQPNTAIRFRLTANNGLNARTFLLRGIPDDWVKEGEYAPSTLSDQVIQGYSGALSNFNLRALDRGVPIGQVFNIDTDGTVHMALNYVTNPGTVLYFRSVKDSEGVFHAGRAQVDTVTSNILFKLKNWTLGPCTGGTCKIKSFIYPQIVGVGLLAVNIQATSKRAGAPFLRFRGRATKR